MSRRLDDAALREAWRQVADSVSAPDECPSPETLWDAAHDRLEPRTTRDVVDHMARCPACAEAWRLALEVEPEAGDRTTSTPASESKSPLRPTRASWRPAALAVAALLAMVIGWRFMAPGDPAPDPWRERGALPGIESLVAEDVALGREDFVLAWQGAPAGARYDVLITDSALEVVDRVVGLTEARYRVAPESLAAFEAGTPLLWRVEATLPDGGRVTSPAFRVRVR